MELLTEQSTSYASLPSTTTPSAGRSSWSSGSLTKQGGDPAKLARALVTLVDMERPPQRFMAGADAIATGEQKLADLRKQIDAHRDSSRRRWRSMRRATPAAEARAP